tara:strand:- start:425 stop:640 length:216 start_codon:yes stop_codon:yes gene_type:complete
MIELVQLEKTEKNLRKSVPSIETRKSHSTSRSFLEMEPVLREALKFEELYLSAKLEAKKFLSQVDRERQSI